MKALILPLLATGFLVGCHPKETARHEVVRPVLSMLATPQSGLTSGYSGTVEARYQTNLSFRLLGRIISRDVNVGDSVQVGQRLAALDPVVLEIAVRSAEAALANAHAQSVNSEGNLKRQSALLAKNMTSPADFDLAKKANEAATSGVAQAQADLDKAIEELTYTELKADIGGVVTNIYAETGQTVGVGQVVISIANPDLREAIVDIGEDVIAMIAPEADFRVTLQISADVECSGKVREIAPQADAKTRTRRVRIALTDPSESFRLGSTIKAFCSSATQPNIRLPQTAILDRDDSTFVWIVDTSKKKVYCRAVSLLHRDEQIVEIASGINVGDRVVTAGVHSLTEGQSIRFKEGDLK